MYYERTYLKEGHSEDHNGPLHRKLWGYNKPQHQKFSPTWVKVQKFQNPEL